MAARTFDKAPAEPLREVGRAIARQAAAPDVVGQGPDDNARRHALWGGERP